ncbi:MAG TPA: metalloregulator ArsR/SmtB family transcription factor [Burkholderiales bacterium]|nr:metalloregulator ArsR/SmtB family transcription factor [Burkholderiales bacterium]
MAKRAKAMAPASARADETKEMSRVFESAASYLSLLSEPTRLKILHAICDEERSVGDIVEETGATQTNVSRHLSRMYHARVVDRRRNGNTVYYCIADPTLIQICRSVCLHVATDLGWRLDREAATAVFSGGAPARRARR